MENIIKLKYNVEKDKPEIQKRRITKKINTIIKKNIFIIIITGCIFLLSIFNIYLIYNFMNLLQDI